MSEYIDTELAEGVLTVTINRVDKKNALTQKMYAAMADAVARADTDSAVKVVVLTGKGDMFSAGNDLADFDASIGGDEMPPVARFLHIIRTTEAPVIGAINGPAIGVGTTMLLHFDQVFASTNASFALPFVNLGLVPEAGSSKLLIQQCGYQSAARLLMLGERFSAEEAQRCNIVATLCDSENLLSEATAYARKLAAKPKTALRATKRLMRRDPEPLADTMLHEVELFDQGLSSPECAEAFAAFAEKREPDFSQFD